MPSLEELSKKRAAAKGQVTLQLKHLTPLLQLRGADAVKRSKEVSQFHDKLFDKVKVFREMHELYSEQLISDTNEKELDTTLQTLDDYYNEVDTKYYDASKKFDVFKTELEVLNIKDDLEASIEDYTPIKNQVQSQFDKYGLKTVEELEGCSDIKYIAALELKNKLSESFLKVVTDGKKLRKAYLALDKSRTHHLEIIKAEFSFDLSLAIEAQPKLEEFLNKILLIQNHLKDVAAAAKPSDVVVGSVPTSLCPIKLQKIDNVKFNGESRDFATFKHKFETIVVPNRPDHDIGLRLQDAVPSKHKHLVERFKLDQWKEMLDELDKNFGGSRQIVTSVLNEIDHMRVPTRDQEFIENIEKIKKIERDLQAVNLSNVLEQESILMKLENLLTDKIKDMWLLKAEDKGLLKKNTPSADRCKGFLEFLEGCKNMADWTIASNEALPANT